MNYKNFKRIIFIFVLLLFVPMIVNADDDPTPAGARHVAVTTTKGQNVLLGGIYLELGIHPWGSFRTDDLSGKTYPRA